LDITLFRAADELRQVLDNIDPDTGELPPEYESALGLVKNKGGKVGAYILQTEAEAAMIEAHAKALLDRVATQKKRNAWLRDYLMTNMLETGITEIAVEDGARIKLYLNRDPAIEVFDERQVPAEYFADPKPPTVSKTKIMAAIKADVEVPGALMVKRHRLAIVK